VIPVPLTLNAPVELPRVTVCPAVPAAVKFPVVVVPSVEVVAFKVPFVVKDEAVNASVVVVPRVEIPAFNVPVVDNELAVNALVLVLPSVESPAERLPVVDREVAVVGPSVDFPAVKFPELLIVLVVIVSKVIPPEVDPVTMFPVESIIKILLLPVVGFWILDEVILIEPLGFPKVMFCPAVVAALRVPRVAFVAVKVPVLLIVFAVIVSKVIPPEADPVTMLPFESIIKRLLLPTTGF
jgi:hypothetical protein